MFTGIINAFKNSLSGNSVFKVALKNIKYSFLPDKFSFTKAQKYKATNMINTTTYSRNNNDNLKMTNWAQFVDGKDLISPGGKMEDLRPLNEKEIALIERVYKNVVSHELLENSKELFWINVGLNGNIVTQHPDVLEFNNWVHDIVNEAFSTWKEKHILSYSFIINPKNSTVDQKFHCDYTYSSSNLFIPLTEVTTLNATQYIKTPLKNARMDELNNFGTIEEIMEKEGVDALEIGQMVSKPFRLMKMHSFTPHRGIRNFDNFNRVIFCISVDNFYHELKEKTIFKEINDITAFENWEEGKNKNIRISGTNHEIV